MFGSLRDGERMVTLDGIERTLTADDLLICDATDTPIGIGGIMGGLDSEISERTTTIALEMAWFEPIHIAKTASRLGLRSEASLRFDRGVDPHGMPAAIARFVELLRLTCPDLLVHEGMVDAQSEHLPVAPTIDVRVAKVNALLGTSLSSRGDQRPSSAGIGFTASGSDTLTVGVPSWRPDCAGEVDIIEEVARQYGYSKIGKTVPKSTMHGRLSPVQARRRHLREVLLGLGLDEAMPNPFLADDDLVRAGLDGPSLRIVNSLVAEESVLRTSSATRLVEGSGVQRIASAPRCQPVRDRQRRTLLAKGSYPTSTSSWRLCWPVATRWRPWTCGVRLRGNGVRRTRRPIQPAARAAPDTISNAVARTRRNRCRG